MTYSAAAVALLLVVVGVVVWTLRALWPRAVWPRAARPREARPREARPREARPREAWSGAVGWTVWLVAAVEVLLLGWAVLPLPAWVGKLTLLDRVPGYRSQPALGLGAVLLLACAVQALAGRSVPRPVRALVGVGVVASALVMAWGTFGVDWEAVGRPSAVQAGLVALVMCAGFGLLLLGRRPAGVGAVLLTVGTVAVFVQVNPLTVGLGPLEKAPVVQALRPYVGRDTNRAAVIGDVRLSALVTGTGLENLSGLTPYPDVGLWRQLDPGQEDLWNNYAKYEWLPDPTLQQPRLQADQGTQEILWINPCAASTRRLGISVWVSDTRLRGSCLRLATTADQEGRDVFIYRPAHP